MAAIEVENLYKSFKIYSDKGKTLKERLLFKKRRLERNQFFHKKRGNCRPDRA